MTDVPLALNWPASTPGRTVVAEGAVHLHGWLDNARQRQLVRAFEGWAAGPVPIRAAALPGGHRMSVRTVCLGWHWQPYRYTRTAGDVNGERVAPLPGWLADLGRDAVRDAYTDTHAGRDYRPDAALVNLYDDGARLGMHQDKDERCDEPVVSFSVGDDCVFRFGNTTDRNRPWTDVLLRSGDTFVFGGPSRFAFHAVPRTFPGTGDPATGLTAGRLNVTLRVTGLTDR